MTETTVALSGVLILAVLGVIVKVLDYTNKQIMPQLQALAENVSALKTAHALNQQEIQQNTARLNGQSSKIDTLLLAAPAGSPAPQASPVPITIITGDNAPSVPGAEAAEVKTAAVDAAAAAPPAPQAPEQSPGLMEKVSNFITGAGKEAQEPPPPAPAKINVTITADHPLSADEIAQAHKAIDDQATAAATS